MNKPRRYFNGEKTRIGDTMATCRVGTCKLLRYLDDGWTGDVRNVLTGERFQVALGDCDLIDRKPNRKPSPMLDAAMESMHCDHCFA